jgi:hypothetical protein
MKQEIMEKYLMISAEKELTKYQLKAMIQEIADSRSIREYALWMQVLKEIK